MKNRNVIVMMTMKFFSVTSGPGRSGNSKQNKIKVEHKRIKENLKDHK